MLMAGNFFNKNKPFLLSGFFILTILTAAVFIFPKPRVFIFLNGFHNKFLDYFFRIVTHLGDGIFVIALAIILFFARKRALSFLIVSSYALSGLIVQIVKEWFPVPRPAMYFKLHEIEYSHFVKDVILHNYYSFPSGHTASAFALAASLAFITKNKNWGFWLLVGAVLVGYSRIYLGQHFPEDVAAGMALGLASTTVCHVLFLRYFNKWEGQLNRRKQ